MSEAMPPTEDLGVVPMASKEEHMALLADLKAPDLGPLETANTDLGPVEPGAPSPSDLTPTEPVSFTAWKAARGPAPEQATKALQFAKGRGVSPQFAADNLDAMQRQIELSGFEDMLGSSPVLAAYAGQSGVHASAVKDDVGVLGALEQGLMDIGYQEIATAQMSFPTGVGERILRNYETETAAFDQRPAGIVADFARSAPSLAAYYLAGTLGRRLGGKPGEIGATAGLMYGLNRGALYRRILQDAPNADELALRYTEDHPGQDVSDEQYAAFVREGQDFERKARVYATVGATASAALGAGLSSAISLAVPGGARKVQTLSTEIIARAFSDPTTRAVVEKLATAGAHTLAGALYMAVPAVVDDATVQKAVTGQIDLGQSMKAGWDAFKRSLLAAGVLSTAPQVLPLVRDLGRARQAPAEVARLDHLIEQAQASKLRQRSPAEFEQVAGQMAAQGDAPTVYIDGEAAQRPEVAQKLVEALADEGQALAEAQATGGDVAVPTEKYLTALTDQHEALREDVKLDPEGATIRQAQELLNGPVSKLLAERTMIESQPDSPAKTSALQDLHERMRDVVASQYRMDPQEYAKAFTDHAQKLLAGAVNPEARPLPGTQIDGRAAADWAAHLIDTKPIAEIQPGRYELAARTAEDKLAAVAKEGAEKGTEAARQGFLAAGVQAADSAAHGAGKENLRVAGRTADVAGRRLDKLPMLERARDLARAMAAQATEVREEMDKARTFVESRDVDKYRGQLFLAGPEYRDAFDAISEAIDDNTPRAAPNPQALETLLARMDRDGQLVGFDENALRTVLTGNKGWKKLTPPEARNVADAVKNIFTAAQATNEIRLSDQKYTLREFVDSVTAEASTRKDLGSQPLTRSAASAMEGLARTAGLINATNLKPETIFDRLGETAHRFYEDKLITARNRKAELQGGHLKYFIDNFDKQMRGLRGWLREPIKTSLTVPEGTDLDGTKVNRETLALAFLNLGTEGNEQRLTSGYQWDPATVREEIGKHVSREKLDLLQGILSYNDKTIWPLIRDHAEKKTGIAPPKVVAQEIVIPLPDGTEWRGEGGYFPAAPNRDALGVPEVMQAHPEDGVETDKYARATVQDSFTKARAKKATYPVDLNWSRYPAHLASVFHYLAYDDAVGDVGKLLRDDDFQRTTRHYVGQPYLDQLKQDQRVWARGSVGDANGVLDYISRSIGRVFRTRAISNALAFSTPIALGQESHIQYAITSGQISVKNATAAMTRQVPWTDTWVATRAVLDEVRFRSDRYADDFREALSGQPARTLLGHGIDRAAFAQMEAADAMLSHVIGDAALNDALEAGMEMPDAVREANRKLRLLMPTHNVMEMAPIVRGKGTIGALMLFRGLPNVVWNVESGIFDEARQSVAGASGATQLAAAGGRVALNSARAVASLAVLHMLGRLLMGHGKKDEDGEGLAGWATWAERESISSQFSRIPLGRDVMEPFVDAYFHDKPASVAVRELADGRHLAPDVAVIYNVLRNVATVASDAKAPEDRVQAAVDTALTVLGAGGRPVTRGPRYLYDVAQGNVEPRGPFDVAGGVVYGQRREKNPFTATQDLLSGD